MNLMSPIICRFTSCVKITGVVGFTQLVNAGSGAIKRIFTQVAPIGGIDEQAEFLPTEKRKIIMGQLRVSKIT